MKRFILIVFFIIPVLLVIPGVLAATTTATTVTPSYMVTVGPPELTSINPWTGETNSTVSITIAGTDFGSAAGFRLKGPSSRDIVGSVTSVNSTHIVGTVNLANQDTGEYEACVYNTPGIYTCGLTFTVTPEGDTAATASSIFFETNPTGATVLLNGNRIGTSVFTYHNATPGTHKVVIQKSGYEDYSGSVTVPEGKRVKFYAALTPRGAGAAAAKTTTVTTATTIRKSTIQVPTTWPDETPTEASPVDPATVTGAIGAGLTLFALRRR